MMKKSNNPRGRWNRSFFYRWLAATWLVSLGGCVPRSEKEVVIYCSTDRQFAAPILDAFERKSEGRLVARQFDVETSKTLGLATRLLEESKAPRCDVFWSGEILHTIRLQRAGLLEARRWRWGDGLPKGFLATDGTWACVGARGRVLLVNRDRLPNESDWPKSVFELADEKWKGQAGLAKPLYGTTATHMVVISTLGIGKKLAPSSFEAWLTNVKDHAVFLGGNKQVAQAVASGELQWGLTDTDDAQIEIENGKPVSIIHPDQGENEAGLLLIPGTVAVIKGGPHRMAGKELADYLASPETERRLTLGNAAQFALWPDNQKNATIKAEELKVMKVDFEKVAEKWEEIFAILRREFP
jgi:iron(III) transport system substrate-binding protein